jgi:hypothetical protein
MVDRDIVKKSTNRNRNVRKKYMKNCQPNSL